MRFCRQPAAGENFLGCFPPPGSGPLGGEIFFSPQNPDPWGGNAFFIPPPRGGRNKHPWSKDPEELSTDSVWIGEAIELEGGGSVYSYMHM